MRDNKLSSDDEFEFLSVYKNGEGWKKFTVEHFIFYNTEKSGSRICRKRSFILVFRFVCKASITTEENIFKFYKKRFSKIILHQSRTRLFLSIKYQRGRNLNNFQQQQNTTWNNMKMNCYEMFMEREGKKLLL